MMRTTTPAGFIFFVLAVSRSPRNGGGGGGAVIARSAFDVCCGLVWKAPNRPLSSRKFQPGRPVLAYHCNLRPHPSTLPRR